MKQIYTAIEIRLRNDSPIFGCGLIFLARLRVNMYAVSSPFRVPGGWCSDETLVTHNALFRESQTHSVNDSIYDYD